MITDVAAGTAFTASTRAGANASPKCEEVKFTANAK